MGNILPGTFSKVRALPGRLKVRPLLQDIFLRCRGVGELALLIVGIGEVGNDGSRVPQGDSRVGVFDGRDFQKSLAADTRR